ncbi:hypothetical protein BCT06_13670 [Vibrio breoganii]|uniref:glycosyltransferase n=1 Tax=Vibrio breoganii TaxID=553239 RepID=UPI000C85B2B3|nr:glycosyltransferase [Vibrio breoganii]PMO59954.1 hypothetical protein BCT06_13670 [Vibrio breoganii]
MINKRVLHVVGRMNQGGVENWLMHLFRASSQKGIIFDFIVHDNRIGCFEKEINSLGGRIYRIENYKNPIRYAKQLNSILKNNPEINVIHSHVFKFSGVIMLLSKILGVKTRISHSHTGRQSTSDKFYSFFYDFLMKKLILQCSTDLIGCSDIASRNLFGNNYDSNIKHKKIYCGLDLNPYKNSKYFREWKNKKHFTIGHVGNFSTVKNHELMLSVATELKKNGLLFEMLFIGDGDLRKHIEQKTFDLGLENEVKLLGLRQDVPALLVDRIDLLLLPSLFEGLPLVSIESQAAKVPLLLSRNITDELVINRDLITYLDIKSTDEWVCSITKYYYNEVKPADMKNIIGSRFDIKHCLREFHEIYCR